MRKIVYWFLLGSILLLLIGTIFIYKQKGDNISNFIQLVGGFSTFVSALLTAVYVFTTNSQLYTMEKQLNEMQKGRELENQPFPWIESPKFIIRKPKAYYAPPNNKASIQSLYNFEYKVKNIGKGVAVGVFMDPKFETSHNDEVLSQDCVPKKLEIIEEGKYFDIIKPNFDNCNVMHINGDVNFITYKSLLKGKIETFPKMTITIYYKNFLGATFKEICVYQVFPTFDFRGKEDDSNISILKKWASTLSDAQIKFTTELKQVEASYKLDRSVGKEKFFKIYDEFETMMGQEEQDTLEFPVVLIPNDFSLFPISKDEYNEAIDYLLADDERRRYS